MATIVNARDVLLQATSPRVGSVVLPSNITVPNAQILGLGTLALLNSVSATTQVTGLGSLATQSAVNLATQVTGALANGNVSGLGALALLNAVNLATQVTGSLPNGSVSGLGALATQSAVNLATQISGSLSHSNVSGLGTLATASSVDANTQVTNLGSLAYVSSLAANAIGAGTLAAGVIYAGNISASQINAGTISANYINGGTISSVSIGIGTGNTPNSRAFEVNSSGAVWTDGIAGGTFSGNNFHATSVSAIQGVTYASGQYALEGVVAFGYSGGHGVLGNNVPASASGAVGTSSGYAFKALSGTAGPFTGAHDCLIAISDDCSMGDIVEDTELIAAYSISNTIFRVQKNSVSHSHRAIGVASRRSAFNSIDVPPALIMDGNAKPPTYFPEYYEVKNTTDQLMVNALGEGLINVCGETGNLNAGDLIITSSIPGKGMRQEDDIIRGYTVAKAREAVSFTTPSEVKTIACIYLCG